PPRCHGPRHPGLLLLARRLSCTRRPREPILARAASCRCLAALLIGTGPPSLYQASVPLGPASDRPGRPRRSATRLVPGGGYHHRRIHHLLGQQPHGPAPAWPVADFARTRTSFRTRLSWFRAGDPRRAMPH